MPPLRERVEQHLRQPGTRWFYGWAILCFVLLTVLPDPVDEAVPAVWLLGTIAPAIRGRPPFGRPLWHDVAALSLRRVLLLGAGPVLVAVLVAAEDEGRPLGADGTGVLYALLLAWVLISLVATVVYVRLAIGSPGWLVAACLLGLLAASFLRTIWGDEEVGALARWTLAVVGGPEAAALVAVPAVVRLRAGRRASEADVDEPRAP